MRRALLAVTVFLMMVGQVSSASITNLENCNSRGGVEPQFILSDTEDAHILNFSDSHYSESDGNKVVCMDDNFSVQVDSTGISLGDYTEAFSVTEYFTDPEYGSHVKIPPGDDGRSVYLDYSGIKTVEDVGAGICDTGSSNCKFLFSINDTESDHGSHVGQKDSGENVQVELRTGFQVNIRSISQYDDNPYRVKINVSADTGTDSIGIFERTIDWNTSDESESAAEGGFERRSWTDFPRNVTEQIEGSATYPETGDYGVGISLRYILNDTRYKYKNRTINLPDGDIEWDRSLEIENPDKWVALGATEEISPSQYENCGAFFGYRGDGDSLSTILRTSATDPLPADPMLGTFSDSCTLNYMHSSSPNNVTFGQSTSEDNGGWNVTRLDSKMNFSEFYEGSTSCGAIFGYGVREEGGLKTYLVTSSSDSTIYEKKMARKSLVSTSSDCKVTTS